jgi:hypothetical protein
MGAIIAWIVELALALCQPILNGALALLGYDVDWEPTRPSTERRSNISSAILCFLVSALFCVGLIWLLWKLSG